MIRKFFLFLIILLFSCSIEAKLPNLTPAITTAKMNEIMKAHATYKALNPELIKRTLQNYIDELDPTKTYFIESDLKEWLSPSEDLVAKVLKDYNNARFPVFEEIYQAMIKGIQRRHQLDQQINLNDLPKHVSPEEFKELKWTQTEQDLLTRLVRIKALQIESASKLSEEVKEKSLQRIAKRQLKHEEKILNPDPVLRERFLLSNVLKATASSLDAHTSYFTPDEASQFMLSVQQRLLGIGAQLRDDLNGFTITKIVEGGPAELGKQLKLKDRIIAVNGEPVVGMDIMDAIELIRGEENTLVTLTVIRETTEEDVKKELKLDIVIRRGEVVIKDSRYESSQEPFGEGVIGYLKLHSFYQDSESSSATDLAKAIEALKKEHKLEGVILDLRYNSGGLLSQAVDVTGLFIGKGVVVSVKDSSGTIQHLRNMDETPVWTGPLIILMSRGSASASEIVTQTLQDYGRALIVGDDHTYGKGTFQTFTLNTTNDSPINPEGEYKVTRGKYYTVSGKTPQLTGALADIVVPGFLSESEIGEAFAKYPLQNDTIPASFDDDLSDIPFTQRMKIKMLYKFDLQQQLTTYLKYIPILKNNSKERIEKNKDFQLFLKELKKKPEVEEENREQFGQNDLQLTETYNIMKDLIFLMQ